MIVNLLLLNDRCPACEATCHFVLQFRYGAMSRLRYQIGDKIRFRGHPSDVGTPGTNRVIVHALLCDCEQCGFGNSMCCYVYLERDVITGFTPADGRYGVLEDDIDFVVLEK